MSFVTRLSVLALFVASATATSVAARYGGEVGANFHGSVGGGYGGGQSKCGKNEFWYGKKSCCLPTGKPPAPPKPPAGHECPTNGWYWHTGKKWCVPDHEPPEQEHPQCPPKCKWSDDDETCHPNPPSPPSPPQPSGHYGGGGGGYGGGHGGGYGGGHGGGYGGGYGGHKYKRNRAASLCPTGLDACPISGLGGSDFECLDTKVELESCGGCASIGQGQDCTTIPGAWNVGCESGSCAVYTCKDGFRRSSDGKSCVAL